MTMITPSYLGETIEYSSLHACRSTLEDPTDLCDQALKARAFDKAGSRFAKIIINRHDIAEAKLSGIIGKSILAALAFEVVDNLDRRGLSDVHYGAAAEMIWRDFVAQGNFLPSPGWTVSATLSRRSAKTCSSSRRFSTGT